MKNVERWVFLIIKQITDYLTVSGADKVMQSVCELMVEAVNTEVDNNENLEGERDLVPKKNKGWLLPEFTRKFILDNRKAVRLRGFCPEPKIKDRHGRGRGDHLQTCRADQAPRWAGGDQASLWQDSGQAEPGVYHIIWRTKISSLSFSSTLRSSTSHLSQVWMVVSDQRQQPMLRYFAARAWGEKPRKRWQWFLISDDIPDCQPAHSGGGEDSNVCQSPTRSMHNISPPRLYHKITLLERQL